MQSRWKQFGEKMEKTLSRHILRRDDVFEMRLENISNTLVPLAILGSLCAAILFLIYRDQLLINAWEYKKMVSDVWGILSSHDWFGYFFISFLLVLLLIGILIIAFRTLAYFRIDFSMLSTITRMDQLLGKQGKLYRLTGLRWEVKYVGSGKYKQIAAVLRVPDQQGKMKKIVLSSDVFGVVGVKAVDEWLIKHFPDALGGGRYQDFFPY